MNFQALILSAGYSRRMGQFKPLLLLQGQTVLARCVQSFRQAGMNNITVVVGHRHQETVETCAQLGVRWTYNPNYSQGMYSSVQVGVSALPAETDAFFLLPVDIALVRPWTIQQTAHCYQKYSSLLVYPTFQGQRGHPPLISFHLKEAIAEHDGHGGLRHLLQNHDQEALEASTFDRNIFLDMDHPEDFAQAESRALSLSRLDRDEAWALVQQVHPISTSGLAHGYAVAITAKSLAQALNRAGCNMDVELAYVCGLVHDMAKGQPKHEEAGGELLGSMGLSEMAPIVAAHRDLTLADDQEITTKEVVYLADKLTRGPQRVKVRDRFQDKLNLFHQDPETVAAITRRLGNAKDLQRRMEKILGSPVESVVPQHLPVDSLDQG